MTDRKDLQKVILLCIVALAINLIGSFVARKFNLPMFLDTSGTIFIAALGGYLPGIAIGFFTNLLKSVVEPAQMYFCSINVAIAIITTFLARKGFYDTFSKALFTIPALTLITNTGHFLIQVFLKMNDILEPIKELRMNFADYFTYELIDKTFAIVLTFVLLKLIEPHIKNLFRMLGQKQAPLSDELKHFTEEQHYLSSSLRTKMLTILTLSALLLSFSVSVISFLLFKEFTRDDRIKTVEGLAAVAVNDINPARVDDYINFGHEAPDYRAVEEKLYAIKNSNSEIKYLYVYKFSESDCKVVFDLNSSTEEGDMPGTILELNKKDFPNLDDLIAGRPVRPLITDDNYGYLLTVYNPVYDAQGKCQCYVGIDFSMNILREYTRTFALKLLALFIGCFIFVFAVGINFIENNIILPVNTMAYCAENFYFNSDETRGKHFERLCNLHIKTGDEIENLYCALLKTIENLFLYLEHLRIVRSQVEDMNIKVNAMDELAHKDSLTGIKNKAAYDEATAALDKKISEGSAKFCIVMVDVNFLKKINDTYGHEQGNIYLMNAVKLICAIFGADNVYRVGGDEFVVILTDMMAPLGKYFVTEFDFEMKQKNSNEALQPWEKISAAVGIAIYDAEVDKTAEDVFKRADTLMYANKLAMKAARTD